MIDKTHISTAILQAAGSAFEVQQTSSHICFGYAQMKVAIQTTAVAISARPKILTPSYRVPKASSRKSP